MVPYNPWPQQMSEVSVHLLWLKGENTMKRLVRISVLMLGFVGTYVAAAIPQVPAKDGEPIPLCPPKGDPNCVPTVPPMFR
jgi:hypothetical protein